MSLIFAFDTTRYGYIFLLICNLTMIAPSIATQSSFIAELNCFAKDMGRMLTSIQDTKIEEIVTYINACKERLGTNSNVATSKKKMAAISRVLDK